MSGTPLKRLMDMLIIQVNNRLKKRLKKMKSSMIQLSCRLGGAPMVKSRKKLKKN